MSSRFKISVVIPVYNVQDYLKECVDSVINQSIGFDCIQIVLINDGSTDDTDQICLQYQISYPDNIIYIEQNHLGVSVARNKGLSMAEGELVTFLDGDDKWAVDSFKAAFEAYMSHQEIGVFSCKMEFFDGKSGPHQLNYKYDCDKIVNIARDYNYPQMSSSSVFIRTALARQYGYKENVRYSEDCLFINEILLNEGRYMVLESPVYMYRQRDTGTSAMQGSVKDLDYYSKTCESVYLHLFDLSTEKYGEVIPYIQFCVMYDLRWRLKIPLSEAGLNKQDANRYITILQKLLSRIDDAIILEQRRLPLALKLYAIELKYGNSMQDRITVNKSGVISYNKFPIYNICKRTIIRICSIEVSDTSVEISGEVNFPLYEDRFALYYYADGTRNNLNLVRTNKNTKLYLYGILKSAYDFSVSLPLPQSNTCDIQFEVSFDNSPFAVYPEYATGTSLDRKGGILKSHGMIIYRHDKLLTLTRSTLIANLGLLMRKILNKLNIS